MDDRSKNRLADILDMDIKAFRHATPYSEEHIVTDMIQILQARQRKLQMKSQRKSAKDKGN